MKKIQLLIGIALLFTACPAQAQNASPLDAPESAALTSLVENRGDDSKLRPSRKITYKTVGERELQLHIFEPSDMKPDDRRPCFVMVHGGGWVEGSPSKFYRFVSLFSKMGWVGIGVEYRLKRRDGATPFECVQDVRSAVRHIRGQATKLGIDPRKIVVSGASAGGHLALGTALFDGQDDAGDDLAVSCAPDALVLLFPVVDVSTEGFGNDRCGEKWMTISPLHQVRSQMPPTLIFHGAKDKVAPFKGAQLFVAAMRQAGNQCELVVNENATHSYFDSDPAVIFLETMKKMCEFLKGHGFFMAGEMQKKI